MTGVTPDESEIVEMAVRGSDRPAILDRSDYFNACRYTWSLDKSGHVVMQRRPGEKRLSLQRFLIGERVRGYIRHDNGDKMDFRGENLIVGSFRKSCLNPALPSRKGKSSEYNGVCRHGSKWKVAIYFEGRNRHLEYFDTEIEGAKAYDAFVRANRLPEDTCNFPPPNLLDHFSDLEGDK
jgi:hypothetical protein